VTERVRQILSWYGGDNPGTLTNLARILGAGQLRGTGRLLVLPVDQGFEHGPARSFALNPPAYDPTYHFRLAIETGCSALAAPLGLLEVGAREFAGEIPLILKLNGKEAQRERLAQRGRACASHHGLGRRRASPRLRRRRLHNLSRVEEIGRDVRGLTRDRLRGESARALRGRLVVSARGCALKGARDGGRRRGLRRPPRRGARRARHQGETTFVTARKRAKDNGYTRNGRSRLPRLPSAYATSSRQPSRGAGS
jgi:hypothetical protein